MYARTLTLLVRMLAGVLKFLLRWHSVQKKKKKNEAKSLYCPKWHNRLFKTQKIKHDQGPSKLQKALTVWFNPRLGEKISR